MQTRGCGGDAFNHGLCVGSILQSLLREGLEEFVQSAGRACTSKDK